MRKRKKNMTSLYHLFRFLLFALFSVIHSQFSTRKTDKTRRLLTELAFKSTRMTTCSTSTAKIKVYVFVCGGDCIENQVWMMMTRLSRVTAAAESESYQATFDFCHFSLPLFPKAICPRLSNREGVIFKKFKTTTPPSPSTVRKRQHCKKQQRFIGSCRMPYLSFKCYPWYHTS